ncbi:MULTISPECIES: Lrp/AsnC family transcriptional regulator [unclassified Streptomyces]|uniref:Lrp/AsnC family transcriptional regulator n=1 Tax=unclassified Streptomyces TaxID=2593676 RepID=UPI001EF04E94|nr:MULTISPECIES: Lrp/AsnC family transcriptional regulator [unclassified Streptomyces]
MQQRLLDGDGNAQRHGAGALFGAGQSAVLHHQRAGGQTGVAFEDAFVDVQEDAAPPTAPPAPLGIDTALIGALGEDGRATYADLARHAGTTALTARRRLDALLRGHVLRLATELDLALLGAHAEAVLWIAVQPGALHRTAQALSVHPHVRFCAATTGPANLVVALAAADLDALYAFLTDSIGPLDGITAIETTPLLTTIKRTGLIRRSLRDR